MNNMFASQRQVLDGIIEKYNGYLELYAMFNDGSTEGATPFNEFYWRFSYKMKYEDEFALSQSGY